jgi:hypothetical protein
MLRGSMSRSQSPDKSGTPANPPNASVTSFEEEPHVTDCRTLRAMELRRKYPGEATCHKDMLAREASLGRSIHPQFRKFRDFLAIVPLKPFPKATLDRINPNDPEYAPGKVRWADKRTQSTNRSCTLLFQSSDGQSFTSDQLAKRQKVSLNAIHQRRQRGWSDESIIAGKQLPSLPSVVEPAKDPTPEVAHVPHLEGAWRRAMHAAYPGEACVLTAAERGMLKTFASLCTQACLHEDRAVEVLEHTIKDWIGYTSGVQDDYGKYRGSMPSRPTIGFLIKYPNPAINMWLRENDLKIDTSFNVVPKKVPAPLSMMEQTQIWIARDDL